MHRKYHLQDGTQQERELLANAVELQPYLTEDSGMELRLTQAGIDGYAIAFEADGCRITYGTRPQLCRALLYLITMEQQEAVSERCSYPDLGIMIDASRNAVPRTATVQRLIRLAAYMGYGSVGLYLEDTIRVEGEPYYGYMRGAYSESEIREMDRYAQIFGMELRPYIQTLAHLNQIVRYEEYQQIIDTNDILLAEDPRTRELLERLIGTVARSFSTRWINIGMDEAHMVGLGKYLDRHGYTNRMEIMQRHLEMVLGICEQYGLRVQMWSDMFFRLAYHGEYYEGDPANLADIHIPENVEIGYWDYYSTEESHYDEMIRRHLRLTDRVAFIGGAWKWTGFIPHNRYSIQAGKAALAACKSNNLRTVLITCWGDDGAEASAFSVLPTFYVDANIAYDSRMNEKAFELLTGYTLEEFLRIDDANPYLEDGLRHNNASKYLLYNDPLIGTFDSVVREDTAERFGKAAQRLGEHTTDSPFFYVMDTARVLCQVLESKADLGIRIRRAYEAQERGTLQEIADREIPMLLQRLQDFYVSLQYQWNLENKRFGFEVQTVRIGGLIQRLRDVQCVLHAYLGNEISEIDELEEPIQAFHYFEQNEISSLNYNLWSDIVSPSKL